MKNTMIDMRQSPENLDSPTEINTFDFIRPFRVDMYSIQSAF